MNTPIYDFLKKYSADRRLRMHMPGHKGKKIFDLKAFEYDITEINGADSLFEASGIIDESERNTAKLYGTSKTCYSAGGSTLCIQTMLALMKQESRTIIAVRNVHKSFIAACALLDISPVWIFPEHGEGIISGEFPFADAKKALCEYKNACIYLTSPDYLGRMAEISEISKLCHEYNALLLVDNAHGAHLIASGRHPMQLGADICCDSAHKMLPALTGGAYLHSVDTRYADKIKDAMSFFGSTSPSYLIMASLDLCVKYISERLESDSSTAAAALAELRNRIGGRYDIYGGEPFHLTLLCDGDDLSRQLRTYGIECEYSDKSCAVLLFSPINTADEISEAADILLKCSPKAAQYKSGIDFPKPKRALSIREAVLCKYETINSDDSLGRVCAGVNVPCPPAIPIVVSGEVIDEKCIELFKRYGISRVNVVKGE